METPFHQWGRWDDDGGRTRWEIKMKWKCPVANDKPWSEDYKFLTRYDTQAQYKDMTQTFNPHNTIWEEKCVNQEFNSILFVKWRYRNEDRIKIFLPSPFHFSSLAILSLIFDAYGRLHYHENENTKITKPQHNLHIFSNIKMRIAIEYNQETSDIIIKQWEQAFLHSQMRFPPHHERKLFKLSIHCFTFNLFHSFKWSLPNY